MELGNKDRESSFADYIKYGGMPFIATMEKVEDKIDTYLEGIYNTVIVRDIEDRQKRQESSPDKRKINDISLLKIIAKYLASVIGSPVSEYSCAAEPPVQCRVSHLSRRLEPLVIKNTYASLLA